MYAGVFHSFTHATKLNFREICVCHFQKEILFESMPGDDLKYRVEMIR